MPQHTEWPPAPGTRFTYLHVGECEFVRVEGRISIVRSIRTGIEYPIPLVLRDRLKPVGGPAEPSQERVGSRAKEFRSVPSSRPATLPSAPHVVIGTRFTHHLLDECELVRLEGSVWVVKVVKTGIEFRIPPARRKDLRVVGAVEVEPAVPSRRQPIPPFVLKQRSVNPPLASRPFESAFLPSESPTSSAEDPVRSSSLETDIQEPPTAVPRRITSLLDEDARILRRVITSLKSGLSPPAQYLDGFAVANERLFQYAGTFLDRVANSGGDALVIRGGYGEGKTFSLRRIEQLALARGFCVARTEVDSSEIRLDRPHNVYRNLISNFQFPPQGPSGPHALGEQLQHFVQACRPSNHLATTNQWLSKQVQCHPLVWLLSDPNFIQKRGLMELLAGDPGPVGRRRSEHSYGAQPQDWPAFSAGTQGDFAAYLLSGLGRLARLMGHQGLVLLFDEMEKWQDLSWQQQTKAGNLLGGLIWAATARQGQRHCRGNSFFARDENRFQFQFQFGCAHGRELQHSGRCNGYPFSTYGLCHVGIAVAMTPRGQEGPEHQWARYGPLAVVELPVFDTQAVHRYFQRIVPVYQRAYTLDKTPSNDVLDQAVRRWRHSGDLTARSAVTSIIAVLDAWRDLDGSAGW
jgi:hypothetical protein